MRCLERLGLALAISMTVMCHGTFAAARPHDPSFQLMTAERWAAHRRLLPRVADPKLQRLLDDPRLLLYTDREMPLAHQDWEGALQGLHDPLENVAGNLDPFGNPNREFPWAAPAGTHLSRNVRAFRFLALPRDAQGRVRPAVYFQDPPYDYGLRTLPDGTQMSSAPGFSRPAWAWLFPQGTVVGEVLLQRLPDGQEVAFEIRTRTRQAQKWAVNVYRPFPTAADLLAAVKAYPEQAGALIRHLEAPWVPNSFTLADQQPDRRIFEARGGQDFLPAMDPALTLRLLRETPFTSALGVVWRGEGALAPFAPTTSADFHVVPSQYTAGFVDVSSRSCARCHDSTNQPAKEFAVRREWYGRVRGSDGIFSLHPFDPAAVAGSRGVPVRFRSELLRAGVFAPYDPRLHPATMYQRIAGLR